MRSVRAAAGFSDWVSQVEGRLSRMERRPQTPVDVVATGLLALSIVDGFPTDLEMGINLLIVETGVTWQQNPVTRVWEIAP